MKPIPSLEALGLTRLEALAYAWLVAHPATTGYKVSKGIGKPTANVYRALEGLERKGAVTNDRASPPLYRAVAPDELLDQLEQEFIDRRAIAAQALRALEAHNHADADEDGVYPLTSPEQVLGRARVLLSAARRVALLDAPPELRDGLTDAVEDVRSRGAQVLVLARDAASALRVVVDARDALIATIAPDGRSVRDAMWTRSALFARTLHDAIANEMFFVLVEQGLREGMSVDELEGAFERTRALRALVRG